VQRAVRGARMDRGALAARAEQHDTRLRIPPGMRG
jgi:hypothetical protein